MAATAPAMAAQMMADAPMDNTIRPTKLFIGGISRRTTTKQLRDHFSVCGRVLDCVAMRQPDGRPRGFGYVTLDSPEAAAYFLREPQMIDDRYVDLKPAVPDASAGAAKGFTPKAGMAGMKQQQLQQCYGEWPADMNMNMNTYGYPGMDAAWPWMDHQALNCMGMLGQHPTPPALPAQLPLASLPPLGPVPPLATAPGPEPSMPSTPTVPDCVSLLTQASTPTAEQAAAPAPRAKAVLGEVTNIMDSRTGGKEAAKQPSYLSVVATKSDRDTAKIDAMALKSFAPKHAAAPPPLDEEFFVHVDDDVQADAMPSTTTTTSSTNHASTEAGSSNASEVSSPQMCPLSPLASVDEELSMENVDMKDLPSAGSAQHASGDCRRCNFFAKGRCRNGQDCTFCHFQHDRRKLTRQEKRDAQAARALLREQEGLGQDASPEGVSAPPPTPSTTPEAAKAPKPEEFRPALRLPPGLFLEEDDSTPACVPTPMSSALSQVTLPPGLCPPGLPSPTAGSAVLSTAPCTGTSPMGINQMVLPRAMPAAAPGCLLSTTPQCPPPQWAAPAVVKELVTMGTQTDEELDCPRCGGKA